MPSLLPILRHNAWRIGRVLLPLVLVGYLGYDLGHTQASHEGGRQLAELRARHAADLQAAAVLRQQQLAQALAEQRRLSDVADQVGWQLIQTRARLASAGRQLARRIPDAIAHDGPRFTGLGPDSLRLYQTFLGYDDADLAAALPATDAGAAAAAAQATTASAGLSPDDVLSHAADYGAWCQQLEAQLLAYIRLHQQGGGDD